MESTTKEVIIYRNYTRAEMNQRRVVGIVIVATLLGGIAGFVTPMPFNNQQIEVRK